jgi:hypothetical protein
MLLVALGWFGCAGAATGKDKRLDSATVPAAFPESEQADTSSLIAHMQRTLPADVSVISQGHWVIASSGSVEEATRQGLRIENYDQQMRRQISANPETRRTVVVLGADRADLQRLAKALYPGLSDAQLPSSGFYHRQDRLILAPTVNDDAALRRQLMLALVLDDNPDAPRWFEQAAASLYESSEWRSGRLTPTLDGSMKYIAPDEDLEYDVFAGICDCSETSSEQLALIRLLLVFLEQRDELMALHVAIKNQGRYTTLLEALDAMGFDRVAWKDFAERSVRAYARSD